MTTTGILRQLPVEIMSGRRHRNHRISFALGAILGASVATFLGGKPDVGGGLLPWRDRGPDDDVARRLSPRARDDDPIDDGNVAAAVRRWPHSLRRLEDVVPTSGLSEPRRQQRRRRTEEVECTCVIDAATNEPTISTVRGLPVENGTGGEPAPASGADEGDPLVLGMAGQTFEFRGRSGAWYANVATSLLQWNLRFRQFESCPEGGDMLVTGVGYHTYPRADATRQHYIEVLAKDENLFFPGCKGGTPCLGQGSLEIVVDGNLIIDKPGDYPLSGGSRIVAYNTFEYCARKWHDYDEGLRKRRARMRLAGRKLSPLPSEHDLEANPGASAHQNPMDYVRHYKDKMVNPEGCEPWMAKREANDDLFAQLGGWSTIHIETPLVNFHVEYHQSLQSDDVEGDGSCSMHSIDSYVSGASPELAGQDWKGILGETRKKKYYEDGTQVLTDRTILLAGKNDEDYEVNGPFGTEFNARYFNE